MPKPKKPLISNEESLGDILGFRNLFIQSKGIIGKHFESTASHWSRLEDFVVKAKATLENIGKNNSSDIISLNGTTNTSKKYENQVISNEENEGPRKRKKRKSSKCDKSSVLEKVNSSQVESDKASNHEDKENRNINSSLKMKGDASLSNCSHSPANYPSSKRLPSVREPDSEKVNCSNVVPEVVATDGNSSEHTKAKIRLSVCKKSFGQLREKADNSISTCGIKCDDLTVVLQKLTSEGPEECNQSRVPSNDSNIGPDKRSSSGEQIRTSTEINIRDSVVLLERLTATQCKKLTECSGDKNSNIYDKRKLSEEMRKSSHLVLESASRMSETRRRSSIMRVKVRSSIEFLKASENPVNKKAKVSYPEDPCSSETEDSSRSKISTPLSSEPDIKEQSTDYAETTSGSKITATDNGSSSNNNLTAAINLKTQSVMKNGQLNRKRSYESMGYKTPESNRKDYSNSALKFPLNRHWLSSSKTTPKSTFVFSSSKVTTNISRSKLLSSSYSTKPCTALQGAKTEKEKYKQDETRWQQEKEQAILKKHQLLQMKVENAKRKREERMQKNLETRQQRLKEIEERNKYLEEKDRKLSNIAKEKEKLKEIKKPKPKVLSSDEGSTLKKLYNPKIADKASMPVEPLKPQTKEKSCSKPSVSVVKHTPAAVVKHSDTKASKPSEAQPTALNATFVKNEEEHESYEMTPCRPRSTYCNYDITQLKSDDESEDECAPSKPVPAWAIGVRLKEALLRQYYSPINTDELFGPISIPDLGKMFAEMKTRYIKRTSSAIWNTPDRVVFALKPYS